VQVGGGWDDYRTPWVTCVYGLGNRYSIRLSYGSLCPLCWAYLVDYSSHRKAQDIESD